MFENPKDRAKIKNIFKNISDVEKELVPKFKFALKNSNPIALYIATKDQNDMYFRKGQLNILAHLLNLESIVTTNYEEAAKASEEDD